LLLQKGAYVFLLIGIGMSLPLWLNRRLFPMVPIQENFPMLPVPWDAVLLGLFALVAVANLILNNRKLQLASLVLLFLLVLQDQMRWQPWVYTYALVILPFTVLPWQAEQEKKQNSRWLLRSVQVLLIGIYFWSGLNKMNPGFTQVTYPLMLSKLFGLPEGSSLHEAAWVGYVIPVIEMAVAVGLFFPKSRKFAVWGAVFTHLIIIAYLISMGENGNPIVIPWNVAMLGFVLLSFFLQSNKITFRETVAPAKKKQKAKQRTPWVLVAIVLLTWFMPLLRFAGKWDNYLSFNLYSDSIKYLYVGLRGSALQEADERLAEYYLESSLMEEGETLDVFTWSFDELNVPVYPERRVYKAIARQFCEGNEQEYIFIEYQLPFSAENYEVFRCGQW